MKISITFNSGSFDIVNSKLELVKFIKCFTNLGLKESKDILDSLTYYNKGVVQHTIWHEITLDTPKVLEYFLKADANYNSLKFRGDWHSFMGSLDLKQAVQNYLIKENVHNFKCIAHNTTKSMIIADATEMPSYEYDTTENNLFTFKSK
jgi:hypothetical protein